MIWQTTPQFSKHCITAKQHRTCGFELNAASLKFVKRNSFLYMYKMSLGTRSAGTRQTIWRTTFNLRYLIENRNRAVLFHHDWIEFISVFPNSCWWNRFQALCHRLCLYQERSSKPKVRRYLLTNHRKIIMYREHLPIVHRETHTINKCCHSFPVPLTQHAYWYVWAKFYCG